VNEEPRKQRSRRHTSRKLCAREGCPRRSTRDSEHCTFVCALLAQEIDKAQKACEAVGNTPLTTELWTEVVALSDAWTRYQAVDYRLYKQAVAAGFTGKQWQAIKDGKA
jgi:hypothetical protein